jgi:two-component sensor histidine kinase
MVQEPTGGLSAKMPKSYLPSDLPSDLSGRSDYGKDAGAKLRPALPQAQNGRALIERGSKAIAAFLVRFNSRQTWEDLGKAEQKTPADTGLRSLWSRLCREQTPVRGYLIALLSMLVALGLSLGLRRIVFEGSTLLFFAAIIVSTGLGGLRAGLLASGLSAAAFLWFVLHPIHPALGLFSVLVSLCVFALIVVMTSTLCDGLYLAEQQAEEARVQAEAMARRSLLLAETSALLDASLEQDDTLERVVSLAVPRFCDWATVDLCDDDGSLRRVAVAHTDRQKISLLRNSAPKRLDQLESVHYLAGVLTTRQPQLLAEIPDSLIVASTHEEKPLRMAPELHPRSLISVPLTTRGHTRGALTFVSTRPEHRYTPTDLVVAKDMAARIALAIENAALYHAAQQEIEERKRAEAQIQVLNQQLQRSMTETHHRVKNNLQLISAMLDMRLMEDTETFSLDELKRLSNYVGTLAVVHDLLTHVAKTDGQAQMISIRQALERLLGMMRQTAGTCRLEFHVEDAQVSSKVCTSLALVTNELVSNAVKHGDGEVQVVFRLQDRIAVLEVRDNGPGFPEDFDALRAAHTGLELVESLCRWDLRGEVCYETADEGGGQVRVKVPLS